jgi:hypothetical protein
MAATTERGHHYAVADTITETRELMDPSFVDQLEQENTGRLETDEAKRSRERQELAQMVLDSHIIWGKKPEGLAEERASTPTEQEIATAMWRRWENSSQTFEQQTAAQSVRTTAEIDAMLEYTEQPVVEEEQTGVAGRMTEKVRRIGSIMVDYARRVISQTAER